MIKLVMVGLVGIFGALGGSFFGYDFLLGGGHDAPEEHAAGEDLQQISTELTGVPIVANNAVAGYVVLKVSSVIDASKLPSKEFAIQPFLVDAAFKAAYGFSDNGFSRIRPKDLEVLAGDIVRMANEKLGANIVRSASLEQFNFVAKGEIRGMLMNPK
ncbi:MAG: hypothetical protein HC855_00125 [Rhizobiales bacterium]|nr:hypothetical protein [Hyphomicrobiales bacterium]